MILAFFDFGVMEVIFILIWLVLVLAVGNYGRNTALGYWGSVLLAVFTTPLVAFIVVLFLKFRKTA